MLAGIRTMNRIQIKSAMPPKNKNQQLILALLNWFAQSARDLPWRRTSDPYGVWISEIMLQQTQVKTVIPYWERWMRELPTIQDLAKAPPDRFLKLWEGLGYYTRVRNAQKAAQLVCEKYVGKFPHDFDAVLALPGIGRYTAGAICSIAFNQPKPILDGNVIRVLTRIFGIVGNPRDKPVNEQLWNLAEDLVLRADALKQGGNSPSPHCSFLNQSLMELGALICTPRLAKCAVCPVREICVAFRDDRVQEFPNVEKRIEPTKRRFIAFIAQKNGSFLVRQRPTKVVNASLWEFPNVEIEGDTLNWEKQPFRVSEVAPFCTVKHSITRYRITLQAFRAEAVNIKTGVDGKWLKMSDLQKLAFSSAHRKILSHLAAASE